MADPNDLDIWRQLVRAKYLKKARNYSHYSKCPSCHSPKDCFNYYCLLCKVGGLCPTTFRQNGPHSLHPYLQVRRQTGHDAVAAKDLEHFITSVNHVHQSWLNEAFLCYLHCRITAVGKVEKRPPGSIKGLKRCEICDYAIPNSKSSQEDFLVCSIECLRRMAELHPNLNLLRMRDGAMNNMQSPQTAQEKLRKAPIDLVVVPGAQGARPETVTVGRGKHNPSGSERARTKRKRGRPVKVPAAVQSQAGTARSASESDEEEDEEYRGLQRADTMVESDEDEDEVYIRGRQRTDTMVESDEDEDEECIRGRQRADTMVEDDDDEVEEYSRRQRSDTTEVTRDPIWARLVSNEASGASASARQRGKASGASTSARQTDRGSDPEYTCLGLDVLSEIFLDDDEGEMSADENDE